MTAALAMLLVIVFVFQTVPVSLAGDGDAPDYGENAKRILYVSVSGSDENGDGTEAAPWRTPHRAAEKAAPGDTVRLGAGTYDVASPIELPVGVSLEGVGEDTVLTSSTLTEEFGGQYAVLRLVSPPGDGGAKTDGNQHVSHIRFDGAGTATQAIEIQNRCNVAVHDCVIVHFVHVGVGWRATDSGDGTPPAEYVTGGRFYNNYMKDNSFYGPDAWGTAYGRGALFCGGLQDFEICGNTIIEDCRTGIGGVRGVPIKFWYYTGWMLGCRIHGNVIERLGSPTFSHDGVSWAFAIESAYHAGMEISDNDFVGAVDLNDGRCGRYGGVDYAYATWIHDNRFSPDPTPKEAHENAAYEETAVVLEARTERTIIERNRISGYNQVLYFNIREGVYDFTFRDNVCTELGGAAGSMFRVDGIGSGMVLCDFSITNNLFESGDGTSGFGIIVGQAMDAWSGKDIVITGNAVGNPLWNWLAVDHYTSIEGLTIRDNLFFNAGDGCRIRSEDDVSGYVFSGNEAVGGNRWNEIREEMLTQLASQGEETPAADTAPDPPAVTAGTEDSDTSPAAQTADGADKTPEGGSENRFDWRIVPAAASLLCIGGVTAYAIRRRQGI